MAAAYSRSDVSRHSISKSMRLLSGGGRFRRHRDLRSCPFAEFGRAQRLQQRANSLDARNRLWIVEEAGEPFGELRLGELRPAYGRTRSRTDAAAASVQRRSRSPQFPRTSLDVTVKRSSISPDRDGYGIGPPVAKPSQGAQGVLGPDRCQKRQTCRFGSLSSAGSDEHVAEEAAIRQYETAGIPSRGPTAIRLWLVRLGHSSANRLRSGHQNR